MKFSATFRVARVNLPAYRNALKKVLTEAISEATFAWLNTTTNYIPVWSGASLATFRQLALAVQFQINISPVSNAPNRINLGLTNSSGKVDLSASADGKVSFTYGTTLAHLIYNEFNNANVAPDPTLFGKLLNPGPYDFLGKGQLAFQESVRDVRLPDPTKSFTIKTVRVQ